MVSILISCNWDGAEAGYPITVMSVWPLVPWGCWPLTTISGLSAAAQVWGSHGDSGARPDNFKPIKIWVVNLSRANRINVEWLGWAPTLHAQCSPHIWCAACRGRAGEARVIRPRLHRASHWISAANQSEEWSSSDQWEIMSPRWEFWKIIGTGKKMLIVPKMQPHEFMGIY